MTRLGKPNRFKIYPSVGETPGEGHDLVHLSLSAWERDVFAFLAESMRPYARAAAATMRSRWLRRSSRNSGRHQWVLGLLALPYAEVGRVEAARAVHAEMEGRSRHEFVSPFWLAQPHGTLETTRYSPPTLAFPPSRLVELGRRRGAVEK